MILHRLGFVALAVYGASFCGAVISPNARQRHTVAIDSGTVRQATSMPHTDALPSVGFALNVHYIEQLQPHRDALEALARLGVDSVEILTPAFQQDGAADSIEIQAAPGRCPRREDLVALLQHARKLGLNTTLMPVVLFTKPRGNEWRGKISPENWQTWWDSYERMIDYFLDIAIESDVQVFTIGSELLTTERQTPQWRRLIRRIRARFDGKLMYSTNWDHYHVPTFWQDLDYIGVSGYWDLTTLSGQTEPTDAQLSQRWGQIRQKLMAFAVEQKRPIVLTEVGYPSVPWALKDPWNYINSDDVPSDPDTQARGYKAFLAVWDQDLSRSDSATPLAGMFFYEWDVYRRGGRNDTGYGVRGKPALKLIQQWLDARVPRQ
jgi:hypothetical protein